MACQEKAEQVKRLSQFGPLVPLREVFLISAPASLKIPPRRSSDNYRAGKRYRS